MSMRAMLTAVRGRLLSAGGYTEDTCGVRPDMAPPPIAGQVWVSVYPVSVRQTDPMAQALDEEVVVGVTVILKAGWVPMDRLGEAIVEPAWLGVYARAEAIRSLLHMDYLCMDDANALIPLREGMTEATRTAGFVEPLRFQSMSGVRTLQPSDIGAADDTEQPAAEAVELTFMARRVQVIEVQT